MGESRNVAKVGEILLDAGIIDDMQLAAALGEQSQWGSRLGATLVKMGMVSEADLIRALALQHGLPVASVSGKRIPADVIALVPARIAFDHGVLPLFVKPGDQTSCLFLGMEDPSNLAVLDDLSFRTGLEIQPVMVGPTELSEGIDRFYLRDGERSVSESSADNETLGEPNLRRLDGPFDDLGNMVDLDPNEGMDLETDDDAIGGEEAAAEAFESDGPPATGLSPDVAPDIAPDGEPLAAPAVDPVFGGEPGAALDEAEDPETRPEETSFERLPPLGVAPNAPGNATDPEEAGSALKALRPFALEGANRSSDARIVELEAEVERAHHEHAKTRAVLIAMTQILHERGLLPFELLQQRTAKIKSEETSD